MKIYNFSHKSGYDRTAKLSSEAVWNAFYIHALLLHHRRQHSVLELPHHGEQADRLTAALNARNEQMVGIGQPHWAHACDECEKFVVQETDEGEGWGKSKRAG